LESHPKPKNSKVVRTPPKKKQGRERDNESVKRKVLNGGKFRVQPQKKKGKKLEKHRCGPKAARSDKNLKKTKKGRWKIRDELSTPALEP